MLKQLRDKKTAKKIWIVLALIIIPAFVFWGSGVIFDNQKKAGFVGKIFGKKISAQDFMDAMKASRNLALLQYGDNFDKIKNMFDFEGQAWERLVLLLEAKKHRIKVDDKEVIDWIQKFPLFQKNGQFDPQTYSLALQYELFNTPPREFEEQVRQNLTIFKLYNDVTKSIEITDKELQEEYAKTNEKISVYYLAALPEAYENQINPTEEEIKSYYEQNKDLFKKPASYDVEYIQIPQKLNDKAVNEDELKNIYRRLLDEKSFAGIAKELGLEIKETGYFFPAEGIPGFGWAPELANMIAQLKAGDFTQPLLSGQSFFILRLKGKKDPYIPLFKDIGDTVKSRFVKDASANIARNKITKAKESLLTDKEAAKLNNFEKTAKEIGLKYGATDMFKFGSYIEGIGASDNFWLKARSLKDNQISDVISMPSGYFLIRLKSSTSIDQQKFNEVKEEFQQQLLMKKKEEAFVKFLVDLKQKSQLF
ncbi:MAG: hypothetical protein C4533_05765 [Candidatus Omnitrophota bacterium]|jgi:hypothetical protein|nr:MAG: hypothetical protein C4533_05765 [Candidatus Omnitrophota bacterium]